MCGFTDDATSLKPLFQGGGNAPKTYGGMTVEGLCCAECGYIRFMPPSAEVLDSYFRGPWLRDARSWYNVESDFADWKRVPRADMVLRVSEPFGFGLQSAYHEIACAFGGTVFELQTRGIHASGTDWNDEAINAGRSYGVHSTSASPDAVLLGERTRKPNVIYGLQVLQRQPEPASYLASLAEHLADDGIIIMTVPNAMAVFPLVYGYARYSWYSYPAHLHFFSAKSLLCLAQAAGLTLLDVASRRHNVDRESTEAAIRARNDSDVARELRDYAIEASLLGEELEIVLAKPAFADRYPARVAATAQRCEMSGAFELQQRSRAEYVHLPDPWKSVAE